MKMNMGCAISAAVFGFIVISGLLTMPSFLFVKRPHYDIPASELYGCNWTRASAASLGVALLASAVVIAHVVLFFLKVKLAQWTAGVAMFVSLFSLLFNVSYYLSATGSLRQMQNGMLSEDFMWQSDISSGSRQFVYTLKDWGYWYESCNETSDDLQKECMSFLFKREAHDDSVVAFVVFIYSITATLFFVMFLINPKPVRTIVILLLLSVIVSLLGLPVYSATLWNRNLSRLLLEIQMDGADYFVQVIAFSWTTTLLFFAGWALIVRCKSGWATVPWLMAAALEIANVVAITKASSRIASKTAIAEMAALQAEWTTLTRGAIPHFILVALVVLLFFGGLCYWCCKQNICSHDHVYYGEEGERDAYVVVFVKVTRVSYFA